jgi:hypothetical protein
MLIATAIWVSAIELTVGLGCLMAAAGALRNRMRLVALVLLLAGLAAVVHAVAAVALGR